MFKFLWRTSWKTICWVIFVGIAAGLSNAGLIATVNEAISHSELDQLLLLQFAGLCVLVIIAEVFTAYMTGRLSETTLCKLRLELAKIIISAPYPVLYKFGKAKILANLTADIASISQAFTLFPDLFINAAVFIGCMAYLAWLSWKLAVFLLAAIFLGMAVYNQLIHHSKGALEKSREEYDNLNKDFYTLTEGIKELKLNQNRANDFINHSLTQNAVNNQQLALTAKKIFIASDKFLFVLYYAIVGAIIFVLPQSQISREIISGYILVLLYISGHISAFNHSLPLFTGGKVALDRISHLTDSLTHLESGQTDYAASTIPAFDTISLNNVTHRFHNEKENRSFTLGPINLDFKRGELVFLIGGNGSGKTTLAMLLLGLYHPEQGQIRLNSIEITDINRISYMQNFSAVFSDFFLFEQLFGINQDNINQNAQQYINQLHLHHKINIDNGKLSTVNLSQGQRKRLALLTAYLEDRPFYVFDEWAADQDPEFKQIFYYELLPELKSRGKTVLAITHDDKYFHLADRCIKLEEGKIKAVWQPSIDEKAGRHAN